MQTNLIESARDQLTPELINEFGVMLNEPSIGLYSDLNEMLPGFIDDVIQEGSTSKGAKRIEKIFKEKHISLEMPMDLTDPKQVEDGEKIAEDLFGDKYDQLTTHLIPISGLKTKNFEKLIGIMTPMVLALIKSRTVDLGMSTKSLKYFFIQQKRKLSQIAEFQIKYLGQRRKISYPLAMIIFVGILSTFFAFISGRTIPVTKWQKDIQDTKSAITFEAMKNLPMRLDQLPYFLKNIQNKHLPTTFYFQEVYFKPGTADLLELGKSEIELLATLLLKYPQVFITIEAFIEESGDFENDVILSENRAMIIRDEIINLGVERSRIQTVGTGRHSGARQVYVIINKK